MYQMFYIVWRRWDTLTVRPITDTITVRCVLSDFVTANLCADTLRERTHLRTFHIRQTRVCLGWTEIGPLGKHVNRLCQGCLYRLVLLYKVLSNRGRAGKRTFPPKVPPPAVVACLQATDSTTL